MTRTPKVDLSAGEFAVLVSLMTALIKALTELIKIMKKKERLSLYDEED